MVDAKPMMSKSSLVLSEIAGLTLTSRPLALIALNKLLIYSNANKQ